MSDSESLHSDMSMLSDCERSWYMFVVSGEWATLGMSGSGCVSAGSVCGSVVNDRTPHPPPPMSYL